MSHHRSVCSKSSARPPRTATWWRQHHVLPPTMLYQLPPCIPRHPHQQCHQYKSRHSAPPHMSVIGRSNVWYTTAAKSRTDPSYNSACSGNPSTARSPPTHGCPGIKHVGSMLPEHKSRRCLACTIYCRSYPLRQPMQRVQSAHRYCKPIRIPPTVPPASTASHYGTIAL